MSFGIPYKGSKSIYAKQICDALPPGKRLVDLFAGGCAVTDCAIRKFQNKWESFLINDINPEPLYLYAQCLCGRNPVSYKWVSRDDFKSQDWATRYVWSFGNNGLDYIYGKNVEAVKHSIETWIVDGVITDECQTFDNTQLPELLSIKERYDWWRTHKNVASVTRLERLERMQRLESLRLPESPDALSLSYLSYERYSHRDGDVVYCDIPYNETRCTQYQNSGFDHEMFWKWAKSQLFDVYVSERTVPKDSEVIFTKEVANRTNRVNKDNGFKTEYLVRV